MRSRRFSVINLLLYLPLLLLSGCALFQQATPIDTTFKGQWQSCENVPQEPMMCLNETDLGALRTLLLQCGAK